MNVNKMAQIILDNFNLFDRQFQPMKNKIKDIATKCSKVDYNVSDKQKFFINKAYRYIEPTLRSQKEEADRISKLSPMDQLWDKYASNEYDEESGHYKALNYKYFTVIYQEMQNRIAELENDLYEARMGEDL